MQHASPGTRNLPLRPPGQPEDLLHDGSRPEPPPEPAKENGVEAKPPEVKPQEAKPAKKGVVMDEQQLKYAILSLAILAAIALLGMVLPNPWGLSDQVGSVIAVGAVSAIAGLITPR